MKKGDVFPNSEFCDTIWEPTPNGGDVTFIAYYDKYRRPCKKESSSFTVTAEFRKDGTMVYRETSEVPTLTDKEWEEGQLLKAKDYATEHGWIVKGYGWSDWNELYVRYNSPESLEPVIVMISKYMLQVKVITDLGERNKALKIIKEL